MPELVLSSYIWFGFCQVQILPPVTSPVCPSSHVFLLRLYLFFFLEHLQILGKMERKSQRLPMYPLKAFRIFCYEFLRNLHVTVTVIYFAVLVSVVSASCGLGDGSRTGACSGCPRRRRGLGLWSSRSHELGVATASCSISALLFSVWK